MSNEDVVKMVGSLASGDNVAAQDAFKSALTDKIGQALDTKRQSSLLKAAAVNDGIKRQNRAAYERAVNFKETFEANKATAERNEDESREKMDMFVDAPTWSSIGELLYGLEK